MATREENIILNLPFDEAQGATTAYDYSRGRHDATLTGADFVPGRQGNCIEFDGEGKAEIETDFVTLSSNFTLTAWIRRKEYPDGYTGSKIGVFFNCAGTNNYREAWYDVNPETWGFWAVVKNGREVSVYLDTQLIGTLELPSSSPVGFSILQDIYGTEYGYGCLDEVKIYDVALTQEEITELISTATSLEYYLNGVNFKEHGVRVSSSNGILDRPAIKKPYTVEWPDEHGEVVDLSGRRFQPREITLSCFIQAKGKIDFVTKLNAFLEQFDGDGTQRLMIDIHPTKPLVYEVYLPNVVAISKRWNDDLMVGTFTLKLKEPDPVKRVVRHQRTSSATATLSITLASPKLYTIYWGDGTATYDVTGGSGVTVTHEYAAEGIYYAIVAGVIEDITSFQTNGIVVWNKL